MEALPDGSIVFPDNKLISINLIFKNVIGSYYDADRSDKKAAYDALCEKHGDMTFDRIIKIQPWENVMYPAVDFVSIKVTSDADFDAEHPEGEPLNDILTFDSCSAKPYIDSGYTEYDKAADIRKYSVINKNLAEVTVDDLTLLGTGQTGYEPVERRDVGYLGILIFNKEPTLSKTHTFTVTMTADDGRVFEASVDMEFE